MIKLREDQLDIVKYRGGRMAVPSVAGAGKTTTIAALVTELVKDGLTDEGKILIVTYMNSAAANFKSRVQSFLREANLENIKDVEVMTLHSLSSRIVRDRCDILGISRDFDVIDESDRLNLIKNCTDYWAGMNKRVFTSVLDMPDKAEDFKVKFYDIASRMISYFKSLGYAYKDIMKYKNNLSGTSMLKWCIEIYEEYTVGLNRKGLLDYDDLILLALKSLEEDEGLRERFQKRWAYIFEDEAQDSNPLQEKILSILSGHNGNLVRVGDSNQAIMSTFTSSTPSLFKNFSRDGRVDKRVLKYSNRNSKDIIEMANRLVEFSNEISVDLDVDADGRLEKQFIYPVELDGRLLNPSPDGYYVGGAMYDTREMELMNVCRMAFGEVSKHPDKTVAVLVRTNTSVGEACAYLKKLGAKYYEFSSFPDMRSRAIKIIGRLLDYCINPDSHKKLIEAVSFIYFDGVMDKSLASFLYGVNIEELLFPKDRDKLYERLEGASSFGNIEKLKTGLFKISELLMLSTKPLEEVIISIAGLFDFDREMTVIAHRVAYEAESSKKLNPLWNVLDLVNSLNINDLRQSKGVYRYFSNLVYDRHGFEPEKGVINVCTYHKAKGLEWDVVFLTSLTRNSFPCSVSDKFMGELWYLKGGCKNPEALIKWELSRAVGNEMKEDPVELSKKEIIAEGLRLLYVGITRAREKLFMSASRKEWSETDACIYFKELSRLWNERRKGMIS